jgi:hypothetical protein
VFRPLFILVLLLPLTLIHPAIAQQAASSTEPDVVWNGKIEEEKSGPTSSIPFLKFDSDTIRVEGTGNLHYTRISGKFSETVRDATLNSKEILVNPNGTFEIPLGFPLDAKTFTITVIDTRQKVFRAKFKITPLDLPDQDSGQRSDSETAVVIKRLRYSAGAGLTLLSFRQRNVNSFSQMAATVKVSGSYRLVPDKYDLGVSAFFNLIPFSSSSPDGNNIQYLGINARVGRQIIKAPSKFRLNVNAGIYYNTSVSQRVGFTNMLGPQLYPEAIWMFDNGSSLLGYAKYSPALSNSFSISLSSNREVAMGFHYSFQLLKKHRVSVGFDLSQLSLKTDTDWASTNTYSLTAGYAF